MLELIELCVALVLLFEFANRMRAIFQRGFWVDGMVDRLSKIITIDYRPQKLAACTQIAHPVHRHIAEGPDSRTVRMCVRGEVVCAAVMLFQFHGNRISHAR